MQQVVYRLSQPNTVLRDKHIYNCDREFIRVTGGSGLIENVSARGLGDNLRPSLPTGIKFQDGGTDWTVRNAKMSGFAMRPVPGKYRNGDGFSSELPNARITFLNCQSADNGDGGFDLKGPDWLLDNCVAERNSHNYRFWSSGHAKTLQSLDPILDDLIRERFKPIHVHICPSPEHKERQQIIIENLIARGAGTVLLFQTDKKAIPPRCVIRSHDIAGADEPVRIIGEAPEIIWETGMP